MRAGLLCGLRFQRLLGGVAAAVLFAAGSFALTAERSAAAGSGPPECSRAAARAVIHEHPHLHPFAPSYEAPGAVLCGPFLGKGEEAMVVSFAAATCGGSMGWAAFRRRGGEWVLAWRYGNGQRSLRAEGARIVETLNILRPDDPRCVPTGGTKSRLWSWRGGRFHAGPWDLHPAGPDSFLSPDRQTWCLIDAGSDGYAYCFFRGVSAGEPPVYTVPQRSAHLDSLGKVGTCLGDLGLYDFRTFTTCGVNWDSRAPVLPVGARSVVEPFRCASRATGIECVLGAGAGAGRGFRINDHEAVRIAGP